MARGRGGGGGRILPSTRNADDTTPILGADSVSIQADHNDAIISTENKSMDDKTRKNYRNRLNEIMDWTEENYHEYYEIGVRELTEDELVDQVLFPHKNTRDLIYVGLNVGIIKSFLSEKKVKLRNDDGSVNTLSSFSHIRKYDDAIKWGAKVTKSRLPREYYHEMDAFISAYQKEHAAAKKEGMVDERDADPITSALFKLICQWAVNAGNMFVWVFSLCMWNLMSRSISVDSLALHNLKRGPSDSIKFKYDETKADKTGEFVTEKNCYANPHNPFVCFFLALAVWISLNAEVLEHTEKLFLIPGAKIKSASQRYCRQLTTLCNRHFEEAKRYLRVSRCNAHGIRKGAGIHGSSASTLPPSFVSVAARGEWSIGKILDVYFKFACGGDEYLGRILAFLDPNKPSFATLPPHWKDANDENVKRGIQVAFGNVQSAHGDTNHDPSGLLSLLLASMVYHSDWIQQIKSKYPNHPFGLLPLFDKPELLNALKDQVTLEANDDVPIVTGSPPHVEHAIAIKNVFELCTEQKTDLKAYRGIFKLMEKAVTVPQTIDDDFVSASYTVATNYLKANYSFLFAKHSEDHMSTWKVGTWFRKTSRSEVEKYGTAEDKSKLPSQGKLNTPHKKKRSFTISNRRGANKVAKRGSRKEDCMVASEEASEETTEEV